MKEQMTISIGVLSIVILLGMLLLPAAASERAVSEAFQQMYPQVEITSIRKVTAELYEVVFDGEVVYMTGDGRFLLMGAVWDTEKKQDITEITLKRLRRQALEQVDTQRMVVYEPEDHQYTINVFTDVDCTYCRKFHEHMPELNKLGIRVNYLLTPFRGEQAYSKAEGVWCARDRNATMDRAKQGKNIPLKRCDNPIKEHLQLAQQVGMRGTPAVLLDSGTFISGYLPPQKLLEILRQDAQSPR